MELEDWEVLPQDELSQTHDDGSKKILTDSDFDMNYFFVNPSQIPRELVDQDREELIPKTGTMESVESDQGKFSQENQLVNKKKEYPNFKDIGICPRIDDDVFELMDNIKAYKGEIIEGQTQGRPKNFVYHVQRDREFVQYPAGLKTLHLVGFSDGKTDSGKESEMEIVTNKTSPNSGLETEVAWEEKSDDMNIWKRGLSGVGAIFTFGVAAAIVVIFVSDGRNKDRHSQISSEEKERIQEELRRLDDSVKSTLKTIQEVEEKQHLYRPKQFI